MEGATGRASAFPSKSDIQIDELSCQKGEGEEQVRSANVKKHPVKLIQSNSNVMQLFYNLDVFADTKLRFSVKFLKNSQRMLGI